MQRNEKDKEKWIFSDFFVPAIQITPFNEGILGNFMTQT